MAAWRQRQKTGGIKKQRVSPSACRQQRENGGINGGMA